MTIIETIRGIMTLDTATFEEFKQSKHIFRNGWLYLVVISLIVGLVNPVAQVVTGVTNLSLEDERAAALEGATQFYEQFGQFGPTDDFDRETMSEYAKIWINVGFDIAEMPTILPRQIDTILQAVGNFISSPFNGMGFWMFYTLLVLVCAKILGGRATVQQMLGLTALYMVPHILDVLIKLLGLVPTVGGGIAFPLGLITFFWGLAVYVKATAVSNEFSMGRAVFAVLLPMIIMYLLVMIGVGVGVGVATFAG